MDECEQPRNLGQEQNNGVQASAKLNPLNGQSVITVDYDEFEPLLTDPDLTEEQKRELLQAIWNIIVAFIDFGFGIHPIQHVLNGSGKLDEIDLELGFGHVDLIQSEDMKLSGTYKIAAKQKGDVG